MKHIFKSKTAAMALITTIAGICAVFVPEAQDFITDHAGEILVVLGTINLAIRLVTKDKVSLFPIKPQ